jgi:hypothetical protein
VCGESKAAGLGGAEIRQERVNERTRLLGCEQDKELGLMSPRKCGIALPYMSTEAGRRSFGSCLEQLLRSRTEPPRRLWAMQRGESVQASVGHRLHRPGWARRSTSGLVPGPERAERCPSVISRALHIRIPAAREGQHHQTLTGLSCMQHRRKGAGSATPPARLCRNRAP